MITSYADNRWMAMEWGWEMTACRVAWGFCVAVAHHYVSSPSLFFRLVCEVLAIQIAKPFACPSSPKAFVLKYDVASYPSPATPKASRVCSTTLEWISLARWFME